MTKNNLLNVAQVICNILQGAYILAFIVLTLIFIHIQIDRDYYKNVIVTTDKSEINFETIKGNDNISEDMLTMDTVSTGSLYITYVLIGCLLILLLLCVREFKKIITSVQNLHTFRNDNVKSFRRIGILCLIYFLASSVYFYQFENGSFTGFDVAFTPVVISLIAFILAEIFKEGNLLLEDKELTI